MKNLIVTANFLLAASLCSVPMGIKAAEAATASAQAESKEVASMLQVMKGIKAEVTAEDVDGYSAEEVLSLWKQLQPELTGEFIAKYGEDNVHRFVGAALEYVKWGGQRGTH